MQLHEQHRPKLWEDVIGQDKAIGKVRLLAKRGLAGRAYWISGQSGTGKTTIARLIAAEIADDFGTHELDAIDLTPARLRDIERGMRCKAIGKGGRAFIVKESHGLSKPAIRQLLVMLERLPEHVAFIFTTTVDGQESLFEDYDDAHPLLSRSLSVAVVLVVGTTKISQGVFAGCRPSAFFLFHATILGHYRNFVKSFILHILGIYLNNDTDYNADMRTTTPQTKGNTRMHYIKRLQAENEDLEAQHQHDQSVIDDLVSYLNSDKFFEDTTVQTRDVLNRLER